MYNSAFFALGKPGGCGSQIVYSDIMYSGWTHVCGVYDAADKAMFLYINGGLADA